MIRISDKKNCCGCSACVNICPHRALAMKADRKGFLYPVPSNQQCTECHLCEKACPILHGSEERKPSHAFAMMNKDEQVRLNSSSGGVFSVMAEETIENGGAVYGASFDEHWLVKHIVVTKKEDLQKLRGSKYVQSTMGAIYQEVREQLRKGIKVLFSGTPCQVAGLKCFLQKDYNGLTTVDFVCHGVPNPRIWEEYVNEVIRRLLGAENTKSRIKQISFRNKANGWKCYRFKMMFAPQNTSKRVEELLSEYHRDNLFMKLFLDNYILRPSCHACQFRRGRSGADFTLADFWGIKELCQEMDDDKGTSLFLQYEKKTDTFPELWHQCLLSETSLATAIDKNPAYIRDWKKNRFSSFFYFLHDKLSYSLENSWKICNKINDLATSINRYNNPLKQK